MTRISMDITDKSLDLIKDLQVRIGATELAEVIRLAISVLDPVILAHERGKRVIITDAYLRPESEIMSPLKKVL